VLAIGEPSDSRNGNGGIVSARRVRSGRRLRAVIQRTRRQSRQFGRPLFDSNGRVVGINAQIYSIPRLQGVSFAIPINVALHVEDQIVKTGKVAHARLVSRCRRWISRSPIVQAEHASGALVAKVELRAPRRKPAYRRET